MNSSLQNKFSYLRQLQFCIAPPLSACRCLYMYVIQPATYLLHPCTITAAWTCFDFLACREVCACMPLLWLLALGPSSSPSPSSSRPTRSLRATAERQPTTTTKMPSLTDRSKKGRTGWGRPCPRCMCGGRCCPCPSVAPDSPRGRTG